MNIWPFSEQQVPREEQKGRLSQKRMSMLLVELLLRGELRIRVGERAPDLQLLCRGMQQMYIVNGYLRSQVKSTGCPMKLNGNMHAGVELKPLTSLMAIRKTLHLPVCYRKFLV